MKYPKDKKIQIRDLWARDLSEKETKLMKMTEVRKLGTR